MQRQQSIANQASIPRLTAPSADVNAPPSLQNSSSRFIKLISAVRSEMISLRERQIHMTQLLKKLDRMIVEKHGKFNLPFFHYQKPLAAPGERDSVCVYVDAVKREYLPYGVELEKMVEEARMWVKNGEGPRPEVMIINQEIKLAGEPVTPVTEDVDNSTGDDDEPTDRNRTLRGGSRRKLLGIRTGSRLGSTGN